MPFVSSMPLEDLVQVEAAQVCTRRIVVDGGARLEANVKANTPVDQRPWKNTRLRRPRQLRDSVRAEAVEPYVSAAGRGFRRRAITDDPIGPYVENDTRPHVIRPRADRAPATVVETGRPRGTVQDGRAHLAFRVGPDGRLVFAREVHHPGTRGAHMFALGAAKTEAELAEIAAPSLVRFEREVVRSSRLRRAA